MTTAYTRRILLVEDQRSVYSTLRRRLESDGYTITVATSYGQARDLLATLRFHLGVFDIHLGEGPENDKGGLRLLEDVQKLGLHGIMPCIILTGRTEWLPAIRTQEEPGAPTIIYKGGRYVSGFQAMVKYLFEAQIKIDFAIGYDRESLGLMAESAREIHADGNAETSEELLVLEMRDLFGKLFVGAKHLKIQRIMKGFSGSVVLQVQPNLRDGGLAKSMVVKVGGRVQTDTEKKNYEKYVRHFLPTNYATQLMDASYTQHLGGLLYTLSNFDAAATMQFEEFYQRETPSRIIAAVKHLFRDTCTLWYKNHSGLENRSLRDAYLKAFELKQDPRQLPNAVTALRPQQDWSAPTIPFDSINLTLPNPVLWLKQGTSYLYVRRCTTHGDLNSRNILMNTTGRCWLIDFYRTGKSHILRDFVVLEADIKFRLMQTLTLEAFCSFERAVLHSSRPGKRLEVDPQVAESAQKAMRVITALRALAWNVLDWPGGRTVQQVEREYLVSLLMATLNIIKLRHFREDANLQPRRELALLSASLICQRLAELSS